MPDHGFPGDVLKLETAFAVTVGATLAGLLAPVVVFAARVVVVATVVMAVPRTDHVISNMGSDA